jgi:predicted AlkP superfamily pyrophosphatase or phosphodiesterase
LFLILFCFSQIKQANHSLCAINFARWIPLGLCRKGITPNLDKIKKEGVSALSFKPSFPSSTFPNHLSIITGMYPQNHGLISNFFENLYGKSTDFLIQMP